MSAQTAPAAAMENPAPAAQAQSETLTPEKLLSLIDGERADSALYAHLACLLYTSPLSFLLILLNAAISKTNTIFLRQTLDIFRRGAYNALKQTAWVPPDPVHMET